MRRFPPFSAWRLFNALLFLFALWLPWATLSPINSLVINGLGMLALTGTIIFLNPLGLGVLFGCVYTCLNIVIALREVNIIHQRDLRIGLWGWAGGMSGLIFWIDRPLDIGVWLMLLTLLSSYILEYHFMPRTVIDHQN